MTDDKEKVIIEETKDKIEDKKNDDIIKIVQSTIEQTVKSLNKQTLESNKQNDSKTGLESVQQEYSLKQKEKEDLLRTDTAIKNMEIEEQDFTEIKEMINNFGIFFSNEEKEDIDFRSTQLQKLTGMSKINIKNQETQTLALFKLAKELSLQMENPDHPLRRKNLFLSVNVKDLKDNDILTSDNGYDIKDAKTILENTCEAIINHRQGVKYLSKSFTENLFRGLLSSLDNEGKVTFDEVQNILSQEDENKRDIDIFNQNKSKNSWQELAEFFADQGVNNFYKEKSLNKLLAECKKTASDNFKSKPKLVDYMKSKSEDEEDLKRDAISYVKDFCNPYNLFLLTYIDPYRRKIHENKTKDERDKLDKIIYNYCEHIKKQLEKDESSNSKNIEELNEAYRLAVIEFQNINRDKNK